MLKKIKFAAWGHHNITCLHETTFMITKDEYLTPRGDCIAAIKAEKGLADLPSNFKELVKFEETVITLRIDVEDRCFIIEGKGDPNLIYSHPDDMVARKSDYIGDRTLMISANKAAIDMDREIVRMLKNDDQRVNITIKAEL